MESKIWQEKVAGLPEFVQQQIADYIDFLVHKYQGTGEMLSSPEKQELEERYAAYLKAPSEASDLKKVRNRLTNKYGPSSKS